MDHRASGAHPRALDGTEGIAFAVFAPNARLVRVTDEGVFEFDPESYRANLEAMIDSGAMTSFWEEETWRETR